MHCYNFKRYLQQYFKLKDLGALGFFLVLRWLDPYNGCLNGSTPITQWIFSQRVVCLGRSQLIHHGTKSLTLKWVKSLTLECIRRAYLQFFSISTACWEAYMFNNQLSTYYLCIEYPRFMHLVRDIGMQLYETFATLNLYQDREFFLLAKNSLQMCVYCELNQASCLI